MLVIRFCGSHPICVRWRTMKHLGSESDTEYPDFHPTRLRHKDVHISND